MKHYLLLVHSGRKLELDESKFAQLDDLEQIFKKIQNFKTKSIYYIRVEFEDDSSNFTKVRATIHFFF